MTFSYGLIIIAAAALPCILFILFFDRYDRFKKEPRKLILRVFAFGLIAPPVAALIETLLIPFCEFLAPNNNLLLTAVLGIAMPEETMKLLVMKWALRHQKEFDELIDGPLYAVTAAMSFALIENILYTAGASQPVPVALLRGLTAVPLHALAGGFLGLGAAAQRIEGRSHGVLAGLTGAVIAHSLYDWLIMSGFWSGFMIFPLLIAGWIILVKQVKWARCKDVLAERHKPVTEPFFPFSD